jgi:hypothetical protein
LPGINQSIRGYVQIWRTALWESVLALGIADELLLIHYGAGCESSDLASAHHVGASERVAYEALGEALPSE